MVRRRPAIRPRRATFTRRVTAAITPMVRGTVITVRTATAPIGAGAGGERRQLDPRGQVEGPVGQPIDTKLSASERVGNLPSSR